MKQTTGYENNGFSMDEARANHQNGKKEGVTKKLSNDDPSKWGKKGVLCCGSLPTRFSIVKNVVIISFAFTCLFTSFNSMVNLQSSINKQLGTTSLGVLYAALVISCALLPSFIIKKLRVKWTMALSMLCYSSYMAAQFYPTYFTMIPTAILLGLGAAPMWSAKCTYLTLVGELYAELVGELSEVIITRFFGIFFLFFQSSQVIGNFISSTIFSQGVQNVSRSEEFLDMCGRDFCPAYADNLTSGPGGELSDDEKAKRTLMSGICLGCALVSSVIVAIFVDPLTKYGEKERAAKKADESTTALLVASLKHCLKPYQLLIIPLTFWSGVEQSFIGADFTQAFITCGLGVHMVGYVMICYGVCDALFSVGFAPLVKTLGRVPIFIFGALMNVAMILIMFLWRPDPDNVVVFFVMAAMWGTADAIWQTQINALYGVIFPGTSEAAFSNYRLWESLGYIAGYLMTSSKCMEFKLYTVLGVLAIGMIGYLIIEVLEYRKRRK